MPHADARGASRAPRSDVRRVAGAADRDEQVAAAGESRPAAAQRPASNAKSLPVAVNSAASLNASARRPAVLARVGGHVARHRRRCRRCRSGTAARRADRRRASSPPSAPCRRRVRAGRRPASVTSRACRPVRDRVEVVGPVFHRSDDDLRDRHELLFGDGALVAAALRHRGRADAAGERDERRRQPQARGEAAEREVRVAAADRVDDAGAERRQRELVVARRASARRADPSVTESACGLEQRLPSAWRGALERLALLVQAQLGFGAVHAVVVARRHTSTAGCSRSCSS